jgi:hypothetical protein
MLQRRNDSQVNLAVADAMEWYSASALEQATVACFLALHEMQLLSRKVQNPVVECRVAGQPAQLAYKKA